MTIVFKYLCPFHKELTLILHHDHAPSIFKNEPQLSNQLSPQLLKHIIQILTKYQVSDLSVCTACINSPRVASCCGVLQPVRETRQNHDIECAYSNQESKICPFNWHLNRRTQGALGFSLVLMPCAPVFGGGLVSTKRHRWGPSGPFHGQPFCSNRSGE